MVQNFGRYCIGLPSWYQKCPVSPSSNRNLQKVYKTNYFSIILHKNGSVFVYDYHRDWSKKLRSWLESWMHEDEVFMFFDHLVEEPRKHVGVNAPGIPTNIKFTIPGMGSFSADKTPYPKGTLEYEFDPGFVKRLDRMEKLMEKQVESVDIYARGMDQHMALISALQDVAFSMRSSMNDLKDLFSKLFDKLE